MPIGYSCPHCGKTYSVADQYAGQSGPCAACGKTITIPPVSTGYAYAPQKEGGGGGGGTVVAVLVVLGVLMLVCGGGFVALLIPAFSTAQGAARRSQSTNNLKQIGLALHNYHDVYNTFPPAVVTDADGNALYSGRVLLLPYLEQDALYNQFDKTQAWDSPRNLPLSQTVLQVFSDPASQGGAVGQTDYLFVTGAKTTFEGDKAISLMKMTDGTSNTIVVVEVQNSGINWAEPRDLDLSLPQSLPAGNHSGGNLVLFADGSVRFLPQTTPPAQIHAAATKDGGEVVMLP